MHTPEQAKDLWCPMVRWTGISGASVNVDGRCRAEQCAMWRWEVRNVTARMDSESQYALTGRGYCGLAGRPEVAP